MELMPLGRTSSCCDITGFLVTSSEQLDANHMGLFHLMDYPCQVDLAGIPTEML